MKLRSLVLILVLILGTGFVVRAVGIDYGLPFAYHDDEPIIVNYALAYGAGDFNPHVFKMAPFLSYFLFFLYGVFFTVGYIARYFRGLSDFAYLYLNDPTSFYMIGRVAFGLLCGTGSVLLLYFVGKRYFSKAAGLLAALFLAFNYLHVRDSHYLYFDVPLIFFVLLFFVKLCDLAETSVKRKDYVLSGVFFALAFSVKYTAVFLALPFFLALARSLYISKDRSLSLKIKDVLSCGIS
ncbi:MAG: glycosyltransferase family 39 protein, partial [Candidatus Omnitrophota bacterium]